MKSSELANLPIVSIVTPSYNSMPYLEENIKSVLNQNYPKLEHIIIDGASNDGTLEVLKSHPHLIWVSEKDRGQSHAINKGFGIANGEIIGWLNSDDTYNPGAIENAVKVFMENKHIDLLFTDINIIDEKGNAFGLSKGEEFSLLRILTFNMVKQPSLFMRRQVVDTLYGLNEDLHYVMDREFWLRAGINNFKIHYLRDFVFANFRLIPGTKSFESATLFSSEWHKIIMANLYEPCFKFLKESERREILIQTGSGIYVSKMIEAVEKRERIKVLRNFYLSIKTNPSLLKNRGIWKFLFYGLLGLKSNKLYKFK
ncbi:MAG: glycosyltransferase family 2 protein [Bacteroidales bacterium]